jgi:RNA polymerase sigma-70 factor (ECF subfamily)
VKVRAEHLPLPRTAVWTDDVSPLECDVTQVFEALRDPVYWYVFSILKNAAESEDVTQETFLRLFRDLHGGQKISNVRGWVFRVAHNLALTSQRRQAPLPPDAMNCVPIDTGLNPEQAAIAGETERRVQRALRRLSAQENQCLLLRSEGMRYREIAELLGIKISTVAAFLSRAIGKLTDGSHD